MAAWGWRFFAPFDHTRYFFPWTPIVVSPMGADFFGLRGLQVITSEVLFVWAPIMLIALGVVFLRNKRIKWRGCESAK